MSLSQHSKLQYCTCICKILDYEIQLRAFVDHFYILRLYCIVALDIITLPPL